MVADGFASPEDVRVLWIVAVDQGATRTLVFGGEWDLAQSDAANDAFGQALARDPECLVLDLSRVRFIDAPAVHELLDAHQRCARNGTRMRIVPGPRSVQRVFELCGVIDTLPFAVEDANAH